MSDNQHTPINIVWFKRDLRLYDHAPLQKAAQDGFPICPLYIVEPEYWQLPDSSRRHWHFVHDCLSELGEDLTKHGQELIIKIGETQEIFNELHQNFTINAIYAHEETGNHWTYQRDLRVIDWAKMHDIPFLESPHNGIVRRLSSRDNWSKIRNHRMAQDVLPKPSNLESLSTEQLQVIASQPLPSKDDVIFGNDITGITQAGGRRAAIKNLTSFLNERGSKYLATLSAPGASEIHSSRLSAHLAWGSLSVREVYKALSRHKGKLKNDHTIEKGQLSGRNLSAFSSRLSWRCHFMQKLEDQPSIEYECMHKGFEGMREHGHNEGYFEAWKKGQTGYPFIDACMHNLIHQGWITFRMRAMLVSFASYHLWLDWRKTAPYMAGLFTDYEPGIHYSQFQMQSGVTGINAIRIYSPIKQSQDQDPDGTFIRKWVPELANVSSQWIHEPWKMNEDMTNQMQDTISCVIGVDYPFPIVDHMTAMKDARIELAEIRKGDNFRELAGHVYQKLGSRKRPPRKRGLTKSTSKKESKQNNQLSFDL